ncbi:MAG: transposase [Desulfurococcales archaeon]|nr:transposase [Desulfurococcales archaeon]
MGKYASKMSGGGNPRGVPTRDPDPLQAFRKEIERRKRSRRRTNRVALFPNRYEEETLFDIGLACARLRNELSYEKRQAFFNGELSPGKRDEINRRYYHKYKGVLGVNAGQVVNKNDEAWNAFFELLDLRNRGRLPPHIKKVSPPGYWKDRLTGKKEIHILIRSDRYYLEPINEGEGYLVLVDFGLRIRYAGRIRWEGKQGRLEIIYVNGRWFALVPIEVGVDPPKSNKKGYVKPIHDDEEERKKKKRRIVNPRSIRQGDPIGDKEAFMDMGLNNLFAVVISDRSAMLIKGGTIKSEYYWWKREIATYQSVRDVLRRLGISTWIYYHEKYLDAMYKRDEMLRHLYITAIRFLADELYRRGVRKLYIGYPIMLTQNNGNEYNTNIWWFRKIVLWIVDIFREYGIDVEIVPEDYTSQRCSICGIRHKNGRKYRGLYICKKTGKKINADINAALNIARRLGHRIKITKKIESYLVTHNGIKPLIPRQRANTRDPSIETPPFRAGRGHFQRLMRVPLL